MRYRDSLRNSSTPGFRAGASNEKKPAPGKVTRTSKLRPRLPLMQTGTSSPGGDIGPIQRKPSGAARPAERAALPADGAGRAMPRELSTRMASAFGTDFSAVRIHEGPSAEALGAKAYTQGTDIHFAPGQYQPNTQEGQALLGHELTHVVQQQQGRVAATTQAKGVAADAVAEDTALEREADEMGARVAREPGAAVDLGQQGMDRNSAVKRDVATRAVQAKPAGEAALRSNAEQDAAALLEAMSGLGTDEQAVYRVLGQPPEIVRGVRSVYDARYNRHTGRGLAEDLRDEFGGADWEFVLGQLTRAGIAVPDAALRYERQDPAAELRGRAHIVATPDVRVAVPGTQIAYALAHGTQGLHASSSPYRYQWYLLRDPKTARAHGEPARIDGPDAPHAEFRADFVGNHKVICKVTPRAGRGAGVPAFYEFPQTVVPEGKLAQDALRKAPAAVAPARQLEVLESFLQVLREAEQQPGSAPLDAETAAAYENQIAALRKRLASTEGAERIPIRAVHVDREMARVSPLRAFVVRVPGGAGERETWRLVDVTNPESRRLSGEYEGSGKNAEEAILAALAAWDTENRYPAGRIQLEVGAEAAGASLAHVFQTDGMSFWDSISECFAEVGFWGGMGALAVGVATAIAPVPGSRAVSALVWTSIMASTASAAINIAQRHAEGMSSAREDAMDVLTIAGNVLAGTWMRGARVLVNGRGGSKIGTGLLIGQFASDGAQGILLGVEYVAQYERVMAIDDPKQRTDALMELFRSASLAGGMLVLSLQGTRADLGRMSDKELAGGLAPLGEPGRVVDLDAAAARGGEGARERTEASNRQENAGESPSGAQRTHGAASGSAHRTAQEQAALRAELPAELRGDVAIVESDAVAGAGVRVVYQDGALRIEVGPEAQPRHVRYHVGTTRNLLKYQGPLGQIRRLLDAILSKLHLTPGYGTRGFEARQEVKKLLEIQAELHGLRARLDGRVRALEGEGPPSRLDARQIDRELAEIQEQLEYHRDFIDSYEPGRGFVAAEGRGRALDELPVSRKDLYDVVSEESNRWKLDYWVTAGGEELWLGNGVVSLDDVGMPTEAPHFVLHATTMGPHERAVRIYEDVVDGVGTGERHSLTRHAIDAMSKRYESRFGHPPDALKGTLEWANKLNFQTEFYRLTAVEGVPEQEAAEAAIRRISFGQHRAAAGYDDFTVTISGYERVNLEQYGKQRVPQKIRVIARRSKE
ncbi:eCIS core domain-containing protein [Haliangium ochraceum]|uniref:DUF4157 domain-containing protein n=1 Tax=Haliangium ochraceum (strain DSM 14365 / JCM 11303 / SMP-2) TaxID=502025 RepID=D0LPJ2_HALO1|nr:hypothetical protein Hoch_2831 [Haliangium ochraceum DSM 14365]